MTKEFERHLAKIRSVINANPTAARAILSISDEDDQAKQILLLLASGKEITREVLDNVSVGEVLALIEESLPTK
jgi:hypothetical protein